VRILLGVGGGIAAYKAAEIVRRLRADGHEVRCALTRAGAAFVQPLTLEVLSGQRVHQEEYLVAAGSGVEEHIVAAQWAQALVIAPATAHLLARLALGLADDFLTTTALAFDGPVLLAPAMHTVMWEKPAVQANVATLLARGARILGPVSGPLASGEIGLGRLAEPIEIAQAADELLGPRELAGRRVLVTAGPTHEPVDPVRYLGNRSSGRMGFALAAEAARRGAKVTLVAGPVTLPTPPGVRRVDVGTALEMERATNSAAAASDLILMTAAVADFRPAAAAALKLKRGAGAPDLQLLANPDILAALPALAPQAVIVGFAAETDHLVEHAQAKLEAKGVDFLVANDVSRSDIAFGSEHNEVTVFPRGGEPVFLSRRPKERLAADLLDLFTAALASRGTPAVVGR
jgi:phosphopantothenoylcysteine decarboxylase / phosphopantothenate---cysteine ligase